MPQDINLLPEELKRKQKLKKIYFLANLLSITFFLILSAVLLTLFSYRHYVTADLNSSVIEADQLRSQLRTLRSNEGLYRYIQIKVSYIDQNLSARPQYGEKLSRLQEIVQDAITIRNLEMDNEGKVLLSGEAESFVVLAETLKAISVDENLLSDLTLTKLSKEKETGKIGLSFMGSLFTKTPELTDLQKGLDQGAVPKIE